MLSSSGAATAKGFSTSLAQRWVNASRLPTRHPSLTSRNISHTAGRLRVSRRVVKCRTEITTIHIRELHTAHRNRSPETETVSSQPDLENVKFPHLNIRGSQRHIGDGSPEAVAKWARETYRDDIIPDGVLSPEEMKVYIRLYGEPVATLEESEVTSPEPAMEEDEDVVVQQRANLGHWETVAKDINEFVESEESVIEDYSSDLELAEEVLDESFLGNESLDDDLVVSEDQTWGSNETYIKTHPYTQVSRSGTSPSTVFLPKSTFIEPITQILSETSKANLRKAAESAFGGVGLPYSPSTAKISRSMEQKPIPLTSRQSRLRDQEADVFISAVMPQTYASLVNILTEVRKRLGSNWLHGMFDREKAPFILDAGSGGAGVLAWRDILKAEFGNDTEQMGKATVVVGSDTLRRRAARLLENTTFIPRLPDRVPVEQPTNHPLRKQYDVIIASHQIWSIKSETERKVMVETLWSLLNPNGGVLILLEKGIPRGFEAVAGAREHIRTRLMINPDANISSEKKEKSKTKSSETSDNKTSKRSDRNKKYEARPLPTDAGMIIAPCTNHLACPMYRSPGLSRGRKDWCYFSQRYVRPPFLQSILGASKRNHDDVEFSYLAVRRGIDLRNDTSQETSEVQSKIIQNELATEKALHGYGDEQRMFREDYARLKLEKELERLKESSNYGRVKVNTDSEEGLPQEEELLLDRQNEDDLSDEQKAELIGELETLLQKPESESADINNSQDATNIGQWNDAITPFMLPRTILPPIKRKGHVLFDVCTPSGTIERWFVSKKSGKIAYKDARHSRWGDLWALGAYSRTPRTPRVGKSQGKSSLSGGNAKKQTMAARKELDYELDGEENLWQRWNELEAQEDEVDYEEVRKP